MSWLGDKIRKNKSKNPEKLTGYVFVALEEGGSFDELVCYQRLEELVAAHFNEHHVFALRLKGQLIINMVYLIKGTELGYIRTTYADEAIVTCMLSDKDSNLGDVVDCGLVRDIAKERGWKTKTDTINEMIERDMRKKEAMKGFQAISLRFFELYDVKLDIPGADSIEEELLKIIEGEEQRRGITFEEMLLQARSENEENKNQRENDRPTEEEA